MMYVGTRVRQDDLFKNMCHKRTLMFFLTKSSLLYTNKESVLRKDNCLQETLGYVPLLKEQTSLLKLGILIEGIQLQTLSSC